MPNYQHKIVIAGAGVAGLSAALHLQKKGYTNITIVEKSDRPGGRMKTEHLDGFTLNCGFHVFHTAYAYAQELLDYDALHLKYFDAGVKVIEAKKIKTYYDPFKHPSKVLKLLFSNISTFSDKFNFLKRYIEIKNLTETQIFEKFEVKTSSILKKKKFSNRLIKSFFQPLFSAIFMENELTTSRRVFDMTYKMMIEGKIALPAQGIEAIPKQMASNLLTSSFRYNATVESYSDNMVTLGNGETLEADIFIAATEHNSIFSKMKKVTHTANHRSSTCLYFSADAKPFKGALVCVNANNPKLVSSIAVLTNLYQGYAPQGKQLICVNLNGYAKADDKTVVSEVLYELKWIFGKQVFDWELLKIFRIEYALPNQDIALGKRSEQELRLGKNAYVCGDHLLYGSMNAAMKTGKLVAELIHKDFNHGHKKEMKKKYENLFDREKHNEN